MLYTLIRALMKQDLYWIQITVDEIVSIIETENYLQETHAEFAIKVV